jgi:hypothetical protein
MINKKTHKKTIYKLTKKQHGGNNAPKHTAKQQFKAVAKTVGTIASSGLKSASLKLGSILTFSSASGFGLKKHREQKLNMIKHQNGSDVIKQMLKNPKFQPTPNNSKSVMEYLRTYAPTSNKEASASMQKVLKSIAKVRRTPTEIYQHYLKKEQNGKTETPNYINAIIKRLPKPTIGPKPNLQ